MPKPKHILVLRFSALGDVAMLVPVLRALTRQYPDLKVTVATRSFFAPIFRGVKNVEVFEVDLKRRHKGLLGLYKLSKELKALHFNIVADVHNVLRTKILKVFIGGKFIQIDKGRSEKKALVTGQLFEPLKTTHQRYADVFDELGLSIDLSDPKFPKKVELSTEQKVILGDKDLLCVGIAPFAAFEGKTYPLDKVDSLIKELSKTYNIILFGGGQKEVELLEQLQSKFERTTSVAGKFSLNDELDIISNLDIMVAMDSGNAHLAAMLGVKVVTIWGVTHPYAGFAPFNQPEHYALLANRKEFPQIPTSVYGNRQPKGYEKVAGSVPVERVAAKVKTILEDTP